LLVAGAAAGNDHRETARPARRVVAPAGSDGHNRRLVRGDAVQVERRLRLAAEVKHLGRFGLHLERQS